MCVILVLITSVVFVVHMIGWLFYQINVTLSNLNVYYFFIKYYTLKSTLWNSDLMNKFRDVSESVLAVLWEWPVNKVVEQQGYGILCNYSYAKIVLVGELILVWFLIKN